MNTYRSKSNRGLYRPASFAGARRGTTVVEMAVILPVFFLFLFTLFEFAHVYMVQNMLKAACNAAAREGIVEGASTSQVEQKVEEILEAAFNTGNVTVMVKNAGVFDEGDVDPTSIDYENLPNIDLTEAESRQLFIVRAEVEYHDVALFPPMWVESLRLSGQSVMRHE